MSFYLGLSINLSKTVSLDHFMTHLLPSSGAIYLGSLCVPSGHTHAHLLHRVLVGTLATLTAFANFQYYAKSKGKDSGRGGGGRCMFSNSTFKIQNKHKSSKKRWFIGQPHV